ncbi:MAG: calcium-binding protein, partial [Novosphingobium sp.]|uniref:calcium-binding protein n=1 Tax=Novosphingobium sp. TaxID=1874826 RepID=UPI003017868E
SADNVLTGLAGNDTLSGGLGNDTLYGNDGNDTLSGGQGDDTLNGGDGNDTLNGGNGTNTAVGGLGDDFYVVTSATDTVVEAAGEGTDRVWSTATYTLSDNVEQLILGGSSAIDGTGNDGDNVMYGNSADNVLTGLAGNDTLSGGLGNDTLYGNDGNDTLIGGEGDDTLMGGLGVNRLSGGLGQDSFVFGSAPAAGNVDVITDFNHDEHDAFQFSESGFADFTHLGELTSEEFYASAGAMAAHDASDRVVYDTTSGKLYYDADGAGGLDAIQIGTVGAIIHPVLIYSDFTIIS